ncbi:MAG: hypothetical protein U0559_00235 [Anaerolineae bacterium]
MRTPRFALHQTVFYAHGEMARLQSSPVSAFDVGEVISVSARMCWHGSIF